MPLEDVNTESMGEQFVGIFDSTEKTTALWVNNTETIAWFFIVVLILSIGLALILFSTTFISKILKR